MGNVEIVRFRYAPESLEKLAYGAGMIGNIRAHPWLIGVLPFFLCAQRKALLQLVTQEEGPTIVHAHWLFPQGWLAAQALSDSQTPLIVTAHGSDVLALRGPFWDRLHRATLARATHVTAVGPEIDARLAQLGDAAQVDLLPLGIDASCFDNKSVNREPDLILMVGRLDAAKGGDVLIRAVAHLRGAGRQIRVVIAGEGPARRDWVQLAGSLGLGCCVHFVGWLEAEALRMHYRRAACCVFPSLREGFGLALCEALASGAPVVASDLPAFKYIDDGNGCIAFFAPGDVKALASQLAAMLDAPERRLAMGVAGRTRAQTFSAEAAAEQYARILSEALVAGGLR